MAAKIYTTYVGVTYQGGERPFAVMVDEYERAAGHTADGRELAAGRLGNFFRVADDLDAAESPEAARIRIAEVLEGRAAAILAQAARMREAQPCDS